MKRGRGGMDDFFGFGDPFAGFGGFRRPGSLMSNFFGGKDPFDDPFFTQPFGSLMGRNMLGPSMFGPSMFPDQGTLFGETSNPWFLEQAPPANKSKGPVIEELSDDDGDEEKAGKEHKENPRKHSRPYGEPFVQEPDEAVEENKSRHIQYTNNFNHPGMMQSQSNPFTFQSSTVTYGGPNGAYYTSSTTRRMGGNGVIMEESKEANTTTGRATHRLSRGLHDKGHSVSRKLNSDGRVDTVQMLHNLDEDELPAFENAWKGNSKKYLPGWDQRHDSFENKGFITTSGRAQTARGKALLLPPEEPQDPGRTRGSHSRDRTLSKPKAP